MQMNSRALVRRPDEQSSPLGDSAGLVDVGEYRCMFAVDRDDSADAGAGDYSLGKGIVFFYEKYIKPRRKDVIEIVKGLEIGTTWVVVGVMVPRKGLIQCAVEAYSEAE